MAIQFPSMPQPVVNDQYVESDPPQPTDNQYTFGGSEYRYEALNNRWLAQAAGGATVVVSQDRPDPAAGTPGDLWWYCGDTGEDPGLFTIVADTLGNQQWVQSSPSALLAGSTGGGDAALVPDFVNPTSASSGTDGVLASAAADGNGIFGYYRIYTEHSAGAGAIRNVASGSIIAGTGTGWLTQIGGGAASANVLATDANVAVATAGPTVVSGSFYIPAGEDLYFAPNSDFRANASVTYYDLMEAGGGTTTVNIGGGGGLQLGVTAKDTITTSTTITADDLSGTGPAWVLLGGGGGSGAVAQYNRVNNPSGSAGAGGAGGNYGFFIADSADLVGAMFTAGTSGVAQTSGALNVGDGTTAIFGSNGTAGTASTLVLNGTTYTCTGGGGGTRGNPGTAGAAGTASATGGTPLDLIDVQTINTDIDTYWDGFIVVETGGNLRLGGNTADASITGSGGGGGDAAFASPQGPDGEGPVRAVTSGSGSAGSLQIVYQNQA